MFHPTVLIYHHGAQQSAADAAHGAETAESRALFESWKTTLREDSLGAEKVIRALAYRRSLARGASRKVLETELNYFRAQRHGMLYQQFREANWPIGSGVVEAACKTVVSERLKQSGMRWSLRGGQAILTLRSLIQSDRWEGAWRILAGPYREEVLAERSVRRKAG